MTRLAKAQDTADTHVSELAEALETFGSAARTAAAWGEALAAVFARGGRLLVAGNGGSAAQAHHLSAELVGRYRDERPPLPALCLTAETSTLTALANDYPATELFARQVQAHARHGDVLVLMSTSGRSANIVEAARRARSCGVVVWSFTGPLPNPLADVSDEVLAVDAPTTASVQELHLVALHILCEAMDRCAAPALACLPGGRR